jgi:hypothetical protein
MVQQETKAWGITFLTEIPYDPKVEAAIGNPEKLLATILGEKILKITQLI